MIYRTRVLLERLDHSEDEAQQAMRDIVAHVEHTYPGLVAQTYVERNPPADEIEI